MSRTTLYVVTDEDDDFDQLKELVELDDDTEDEIVGTRDGEVRLFKLAESVYKENGLKPDDKVIFVGNIKSVKEMKKKTKYVFEKYGVRYGWADATHAFIDIEDSAVAEGKIYKNFLKEFEELPVFKAKKKNARNRFYLGYVMLSMVCWPAGLAKLLTDKHNDKKAVNKQLRAYGLISFYYNHLQEFMDLEVDEKSISVEEFKENNKKKNKLDVMLEEAVNKYNGIYNVLKGNGENLHMQRVRACDSIDNITNLINSIANHPKEFDTCINDIKVNASVFSNECKFAQEELKAARESATGALAGGAGGAAIAAVTPAAAMWVATTFGTASTGTAISTLSGVAATKAALAWLGGGSIAAGGGGVAAGESILAMAGPIGIGVAAVTLLSSIVIFETKKNSLNKKRKDYIEFIDHNTEIIRETSLKIGKLLDETIEMLNGINVAYTACLSAFGKDFVELDYNTQLQLGTLVNNTKALAISLGKTI